ncbi:Mechanosensitive ion channel-domain-containing protein [Pterulicium gracile]|uniref:Mechanosensitive ion channel protein n=1 Tax=Pterulicium gracile TaxID=1884261 RepID=A0A5C3QVI3_9AGAR|nr:Mechanosensitive ion channel-domain-containing protein [Pterula gracilis]
MGGFSYPPTSDSQGPSGGRHVRLPDPEKGSPYPGIPEPSTEQDRPSMKRNTSWDMLGGLKRLEHSYEEFDTRRATEEHLVFADGDVPKDRVSRLYNYLISVSIVTRWILFIIPVLAILWIPGIVQLTTFPDAEMAGVKLMWWSIWFSVVWGGWWACLALSRILPVVVRKTLGLVAVGTRRYIDWLEALHRYIAFTGWALACWITFQPLINTRQGDTSDRGRKIIDLMAKLLFALWLDAALLLGEKFGIQYIAGKFHERSYADRIADQKFAVWSLVALYRNSKDIPGRSDTLKASHVKTASVNPSRMLKNALKGVRKVATTTTTALGNVASEIAGTSVLQPNSPQAVVQTALGSANKCRLLARRLFYSFAKPGADVLYVKDIAAHFTSMEHAEKVFTLFDKDSNGDVSRDEIEMALLELHREQLSLEHSMQDVDSAVGRLDNILMTVYFFVAMLIVAVALEAQLVTLVTGAGTAILGLSWLIGGALSDVLLSIIFLFIKHPFDVGDRVVIKGTTYTVKEIRLLSSIFLDPNGTSVQVANKVLDGEFIQNIRRSPQMSETFTFLVSYGTSFEDLEVLRHKMLHFLEKNRRDYYPSFDVSVVDFPEQEKMLLTVDIKYKSNSQNVAVKAKRRNRWVCALKSAMAESQIYGPAGAPASGPGVAKYTQVPWAEFKQEEQVAAEAAAREHRFAATQSTGWELRDGNMAGIDPSQDVFGEADEVRYHHTRSTIASDPLFSSHSST